MSGPPTKPSPSGLDSEADDFDDDGADRRELLERLLAAEARYRAHFEVAPIGLLEADAESGRVLSVNARLVELVGYTSEELVGLRLRHITHPEHRARDHARLGRAVREGSRLAIEETRWLTKSGAPAWVRIDGSVVQAGERRRLVAVVQDVADRRAQRLALDRVVNERDEFLTMLGHQLRNRLAAITTACHLLSLGTDDSLARAQDVIQRQSNGMAQFLDGLQDVVRAASGRLRLSLGPVNIVKLVADAIEDKRPDIDRSGLELVVDVPDEPLWVSGDEARLRQMVDHLLNNATKFTEAAGRIEVRMSSEGDDLLRIVIRDTGRGLDASDQAHAFDPFYDIRRRLDQGSEGLGLGLPLAHGIAVHHGGALDLFSEGQNRGTELTVTLPLRDVPTSSRAPASVPKTPPSGAQRILLVEDDQDTAESTRELLALAGHEVAVAGDAEEAIQMCRQLDPDIVLCDIALRGDRNGYDVARAIRRKCRPDHAMELVAVTGYSRPEDRQRAFRAGFDKFLIKPIRLEELSELIGEPHSQMPARA